MIKSLLRLCYITNHTRHRRLGISVSLFSILIDAIAFGFEFAIRIHKLSQQSVPYIRTLLSLK